ncbi:MAG: hypothetical protein HYW23_00615 [Candidatus Aenigmarchaeota archaeon]|nr:hypothetical protein [Candidatus Aenigmarchaeota archaeon]
MEFEREYVLNLNGIKHPKGGPHVEYHLRSDGALDVVFRGRTEDSVLSVTLHRPDIDMFYDAYTSAATPLFRGLLSRLPRSRMEFTRTYRNFLIAYSKAQKMSERENTA